MTKIPFSAQYSNKDIKAMKLFLESFDLIAGVSLDTSEVTLYSTRYDDNAAGTITSYGDLISAIIYIIDSPELKNEFGLFRDINSLKAALSHSESLNYSFFSNVYPGKFIELEIISSEDLALIIVKALPEIEMRNCNPLTLDKDEIMISLGLDPETLKDRTFAFSKELRTLLPDWDNTDDTVSHVNMICENIVHPDDRYAFLEATRDSNIWEVMTKSPKFSYSFRTLIDGIESGWKICYSKNGIEPYRLAIEFRKLSADGETDDSVSGFLNRTNTLSGLKLLLADDNFLTRELNSELLSSEGADVTYASDGAEAVALYTASPDFDAILMDLHMPEMNGIEATREIRRTEDDPTPVPIIMLTADVTDEVVAECLEAGANDCLSKPLVISEFSRVLLAVMRRQSQAMEKKLVDTIRIANTDPLTHVKNITAYTDMVAELSAKIQNGERNQFGIVICDINGLKNVNDEFGHDIGDIYIKNSSRIICDVFTHSPVYRIGGDEFAVVLTGPDYYNSQNLMMLLSAREAEADSIDTVEKGKASFASGLAIYDVRTDFAVSDTVKRADIEMYKHKKSRR